MHRFFRLHYLLLALLCSTVVVAQAQDLSQVVKKIHPALYLNNMNNERVYRQSLMDRNHLIFSRGFFDRAIEQIEESFHYHFLRERNPCHVLECRFNRHDMSLTKGTDVQAMAFSDFGVRVYALKDGSWKDCTELLLPEDFEKRLLERFEGLQPSGWGYYYYNQNPEQIVEMVYHKRTLQFKIQGKPVLCLRWKHDRFVWH